jgi:hypothetical protein
MGRRRAETDPYKIADAAEAGRIDTLFVDPDSRLAHVAVNDADNAIEQSVPPPDLVNISISETLVHDGTVLPLSSDRMPDEASLAAILRY